MTQSMNINHSSFRIESPLSLPEDEVQLWRVDLGAIGADESRWQKVLSPMNRRGPPAFILRGIGSVMSLRELCCG